MTFPKVHRPHRQSHLTPPVFVQVPRCLELSYALTHAHEPVLILSATLAATFHLNSQETCTPPSLTCASLTLCIHQVDRTLPAPQLLQSSDVLVRQPTWCLLLADPSPHHFQGPVTACATRYALRGSTRTITSCDPVFRPSINFFFLHSEMLPRMQAHVRYALGNPEWLFLRARSRGHPNTRPCASLDCSRSLREHLCCSCTITSYC